jgi:uncharacterized membrane protein YfcA
MVWLFLLAIGLVAGVTSGTFGIGGGLLIVPALILLMKMPIQTASAVSLVALLLPVGSLAVYEYWHAGKLTSQHIWFGLIIGIGLFIGAFFGARLAVNINEAALKKAFAVFLVFMAALIWWRA